MGESTTKSSPWYEALRGIAKNAPDPELIKPSSSRKSRSNARRVSAMESPPNDIEAGEATTPAFENFSADRSPLSSPLSSFSFSRRLRVVIPPEPAEEPLDDGSAAKTTKETQSTKEGALPKRHGFQPGLQPLPLPLPPPPGASSPVSTEKQLEYPSAPPPPPPPPAASSPVPTKKGLELPIVRDFEYRPNPEDRYNHTSAKTGLQPERKRSRFCNCFGWFCTMILSVALVLGAAAVVLAFMTNPKSWPSLQIDIGDGGVTIMNFTDGNAPQQLETAMSFPFTLSDPNKYAQVTYSQISATISYKQLSLNNITIPSFVQGKRTSTDRRADFPPTVTIVPPDTVDSLRGDMANSDVQIVLRCSASGNFKILGFKVKKFSVSSYCQFGVNPGGNGQPGILEHSCYQ